uniref:Uncharacterized protein n=1 Tax=Lactuca sativa TaxID=4236 RepID=A0A9R1USE8_LACSA|nr:hypothetical protein LSAT_V11C800445070 [Lactuca sativa]
MSPVSSKLGGSSFLVLVLSDCFCSFSMIQTRTDVRLNGWRWGLMWKTNFLDEANQRDGGIVQSGAGDSTIRSDTFVGGSAGMSDQDIEQRLAGMPVYALSNSSEEFVVVSGQNPVKSLGLFCFKEEDAETLLGQMKSMDPRMRPGSKVVLVALSMVFQRKVNGVSTVAVSSARNPEIDILLVLANSATCFNGSQFRPLIPLLEAMPKELGASLHDMLNLITGMATQQRDTGLSEAIVAMFSDLPAYLGARPTPSVLSTGYCLAYLGAGLPFGSLDRILGNYFSPLLLPHNMYHNIRIYLTWLETIIYIQLLLVGRHCGRRPTATGR